MRRGAGSRAGRDAEVELAQRFEQWGALVGSRRHIGGAGDLLVAWRVWQDLSHELWLVEVKTTAKGPWERFLPADRCELYRVAKTLHAEPMVAHRRRTSDATWKFYTADRWPENLPRITDLRVLGMIEEIEHAA
jgi:hypothetical protein